MGQVTQRPYPSSLSSTLPESLISSIVDLIGLIMHMLGFLFSGTITDNLVNSEKSVEEEESLREVYFFDGPPTLMFLTGHFRGLTNNMGNLCYLNAVLQSLASLPSLHNYLRWVTQQGGEDVPVSRSLLLVLNTLNRPCATNERPIQPRSLVRNLARSSKARSRVLNSVQQQDAQEMAGMILEGVAEDAARLKKRMFETNLKRASIGDIGSLEKSSGEPQVPRSPSEILFAQQITCITCGFCESVRHTMSAPGILTLYVGHRSGPHVALTECLKSLVEPEIVEYGCAKCSMHGFQEDLEAIISDLDSKGKEKASKRANAVLQSVEKSIVLSAYPATIDDVDVPRLMGGATKQVSIARCPDLLQIYLVRSALSLGRSVKSNVRVIFPEILDLAPFMWGGESRVGDSMQVLYRLHSLVVHYGTHSYGHYVAFRRCPRSATVPGKQWDFKDIQKAALTETGAAEKDLKRDWLAASDAHVSRVDIASVLSSEPSLVFYERVSECNQDAARVPAVMRARAIHQWNI